MEQAGSNRRLLGAITERVVARRPVLFDRPGPGSLAPWIAMRSGAESDTTSST